MTTQPIALVLALATLLTPAAAAADARDPDAANDPFESVNRRVFWFNERLDRHLLEPVAIAWDWGVPDGVRMGLRNVSETLAFPADFANNALQGKPGNAMEASARFVVNASLGIGGFWDVASNFDIEAHPEDFGQTLGVWGVPEGPYLVLPVFGPSSPRDAVGRVGDAATSVHAYLLPWTVTASITAADTTNRRSMWIEEVRENRARAFDYYVFVRNAHQQHRRYEVRDGAEDPGDPLL